MNDMTQEEAWDALKTVNKDYSGTNWNGFWFLGTAASIRELHRLQDCEKRMKALEKELLEMRHILCYGR